MNQNNFHTNLSVLQKLNQAYKIWQEFVPHFPKTSRYTLGNKIDSLFLGTIENIFIASYLPIKEKTPWVIKASAKLDMLKFFLQIAWDIKALDNKKFIVLSEKLNEIGRMLGGWQKHLQKETSAE
jgi:hypothetical protein